MQIEAVKKAIEWAQEGVDFCNADQGMHKHAQFLTHMPVLIAAAQSPASAWLPIESAPRDGTPIYGALHFKTAWSFEVIYWDEDISGYTTGHRTRDYEELIPFAATHWQPLPAPPLKSPEGV